MNDFRIPTYHVYWIENVPNYGEVKHTLTVTASFDYAKRIASTELYFFPSHDVEIQEWNCGIDGMLYLKGTW